MLTPYFNHWNTDAYARTTPFDEFPWQVPAGSTSGAAVAITAQTFIGLTQTDPTARLSWDGKNLQVEAEAEAIFTAPTADLPAAWRRFHQRLALPVRSAPWGRRPEYCTWGEQLARRRSGELPGEIMSSRLVDELLASIDRLGWPRGRFTVDEGWAPRHGSGGYGTWTPCEGFDPKAVAARITAAGHVPGLWLAPALICPESSAAVVNPALLGAPVDMPGETPWNRFHYLRPSPASASLLRNLFSRVWSWGFRKVKLDILYGPRADMLALARQCREAADTLPGAMELEGHVPDPHVAACFDVVRINDVLISARHPSWRSVVNAHFEICATSAPDHLLCLDHIGGNDPDITPAEFLEHCELMRGQLPRGYPVVGLWPTRLGEAAAETVGALLRESTWDHSTKSSAPSNQDP